MFEDLVKQHVFVRPERMLNKAPLVNSSFSHGIFQMDATGLKDDAQNPMSSYAFDAADQKLMNS